ncbi:hypothetical protein [Streptomyces mirabilis]|uniref:hypothetical protein n=1 Tax=Streptomyces mirabilis TaxID=68239 RepID=UPI002259E194|nr:hypothetical protein [Streptomyces mirabilis]MCX5346655.1 hypothetical protein [Streptomyces mirabilis]MCZ1004112.1 hypothetical protein [Streptomyces mirabilis]
MAPAPLLSGILDPHPDGTYVCIECTWCHTWHSAPAADDVAPGHSTHLVARCTVPGSPYRETGYSVKIISKRARRSRSCASGHLRWSWRPNRRQPDRPEAAI